MTGILLRRPGPDERLVIPVAEADGVSLAVAPASAFTVTPLPSLDPAAGWYAVAGPAPAARYDGAAWAAAVAAAHRALAAEIIGTAERALELAVEHTSSRRQFNAPIAAFQAVRHRLADGYVAIAAARALLAAVVRRRFRAPGRRRRRRESPGRPRAPDREHGRRPGVRRDGRHPRAPAAPVREPGRGARRPARQQRAS